MEVSIATRARWAGATRLAGIPRRFWLGAASVGLVLAVWVLLAALRWIDPNRVPGPLEVWAAATRLVTRGYANGTLWAHIKESAGLVLVGFVVAVSTGVPVGLLMGCSRRAEAFLNPVLQLIRPVPPLAWIPLAIVWFGLGTGAKVFVIWLAAFVPSWVNTLTGVRQVDPVLLAAARVHGASSRQVLTEVIVPGALPYIFTGLRLSLQASWTTLVAAELVGAFVGLGQVLIVAARDI